MLFRSNFERIFASHPDHLAVGEATLCAVYPDARNQFAHPELLAEGLGEHAVTEVWMAGGPNPNIWVDITDTDAVIAASQGAALVWLESPTNPTLEICDIAAIAQGRDPGALVAVDGTFTSPLSQLPLALGADRKSTRLNSSHT